MSEGQPTSQVSQILRENIFADYKERYKFDLNLEEQRGHYEIINGYTSILGDDDQTKHVLNKLSERRTDLKQFGEDELLKALEFLIVKSWDSLTPENQAKLPPEFSEETIVKLKEKVKNY